MDRSPRATAALEVLGRVVGAIGGDTRRGQEEMCAAVADAIASGRHLLVEAPTGVGKSLAYAAALATAGKRAIIATATKALQEQLVTKDLPAVAAVMPDGLSFELLKGRSNYLCVARASDSMGADVLGSDAPVHIAPQLAGTSLIEPATAERLKQWARSTPTGDRADLAEEVGDQVWDAVSVSALECPGALACHRADDCFAEHARDKAAVADVVVVNTHLYSHHLQSEGNVLPDHEVVVVDEAHNLADIATEVFGVSLSGGRFAFVANRAAGVLRDAKGEVDSVRRAGERLDDTIALLGPGTVDPSADELVTTLLAGREAVAGLLQAMGKLDKGALDQASHTAVQAVGTAVAGVALDIDRVASPAGHEVLWIDGESGGRARLRLSPVVVGDTLTERLFANATVICTSATLRSGPDFTITAEALGLTLGPGSASALVVDSPFDVRQQAMLYVPRHLPDPRQPDHPEASFAEALSLIEAAGGRALFLHTSHRAMRATAERLRAAGEWEVLVQGETPRPALVERFGAEPSSCLVATMSFWQGIDVPGDACTLVLIDRLPFPRPDQPLLDARRQLAEAVGRNGWAAVDLPRAATMLAQGAGRLIRSVTDRGVVAVLDPRLATKSYRHTLLGPLPPFRRCVDGDEVRAFLAEINATAAAEVGVSPAVT